MQTLWYILIFLAMAAMFLFLPKKQETKRFGIIVMLLALVLELAVFNYHSYHLWFRVFPQKELSLSDAAIAGNTEVLPDGSVKITGSATITYHSLDIPVGTVALDIDWQTENEGNYANAEFDFTDETQAVYYRSNVANGRIVNGDRASHTIVTALSGKADWMRMDLVTEANRSVILRAIHLNTPVPLQLSVLRLLLTTLLPVALYALLRFPSFTESIEKRRRTLTFTTAGITAVLVFAAFIITYILTFDPNVSYFARFQSTTGNQITKELVDAFSAGQAHLLQEPSQELLELENPYDWSLRRESGVYALWDHLLFDGKYYSYYGIAPVLLLFWPFHKLTGFYFPTSEAVFLFGAIGIICLSALFLELIKRFFPKLPVNIAIFSLIILQFSSGIWYCFAYDNFYEIAQAGGFMFTCAGAWLLLRSGVVGEGKIRKTDLVLSAFCLSMAVLSRPTLALYCIVAVIFLIFGYIKLRKETPAEKRKSETISYWVCALICYVIIGGIQMLYNYERFGNFFDFGIQYSLTINDFTRAQYHTDLALIGFWNFLFAFPKVEPNFPFVLSNFSDLSVNGYYFIANQNAVGILWRALPVFGYLGAVKAYKTLEKQNKIKAILLIGSCCILAPLIIIFSIWESGYGVRYCADFTWQLVIGGMCIVFYNYLQEKKDPFKADRCRMTVNFFAVSAVLAVIINFALIYDYLPLENLQRSSHYAMERIFEFWK